MSSLRGRLFVAISGFVVLFGLLAGLLTYRWAFQDAIEFQDAILVQAGVLAAQGGFRGSLPRQKGVDREAEIYVEELGEPPAALSKKRAPPTPFPASLADGLQTTERDGEPWRVLVRTRDDGSRVAVSEPTADRDEIAREDALRAALPLGLLIPCLMIVVAIVIRASFRPTTRLAAILDAKPPTDLTPVPTDGLPSELMPFAGAINRLLGRVDVLFGQQKRFIADAAHELRSPVAALSLQAKNLEGSIATPEGGERLEALQSGVRRLTHLLEQLLALARSENGPADLGDIRLDEVAKAVVAEAMPRAGGRAVDLGFPRLEPVSVRGDEIGLRTIVSNLVDNALRHAPEGGRVDIGVFAAGRDAVLRVDDNGPGVAEAELPRLQEPFFRGRHNPATGTGLGLSIVRRIVDGLGGTLCLSNLAAAEGGGFRVEIQLPVAGASHGFAPSSGSEQNS